MLLLHTGCFSPVFQFQPDPPPTLLRQQGAGQRQGKASWLQAQNGMGIAEA